MPISHEAAVARAQKAAATRARNKAAAMVREKQPFSASYPHLEGKHILITFGEYFGKTGRVTSTIPMHTTHPTPSNPWILRVTLDGKFKSVGASHVLVPQTFLKPSSQQVKADKKDAAWRKKFNADRRKDTRTWEDFKREARAQHGHN